MNVMNFAMRNVVAVTPDDSIDKAISLMEECGIHHLLVQRPSGSIAGLVSDRDVLLSTGWMLAAERCVQTDAGPQVLGPTRVEQIMSRSLKRLGNTDSARHAANLFITSKVSAAPVIHEDQLVGIITENDLLTWLDVLAVDGNAADKLLSSPVQELMRAHVITVPPESPIADIVDVFRRYRIRHVPVCAAGDLVGIVSDRDVRRVLGWSNVRDMEADEEARLFDGPRTAHEIMHSPVLTIGRSDSLRAALRRMLEHRIHSLPVVEDPEASGPQRVVGILTQTDFVKALSRDDLI